MMWRDVIELQSVDYSTDQYGDRVEITQNTKVFANKKSVRQSEFYQAMAQGLRLEAMFEVRSMEYEGQRHLVYNNKVYVITRTYTKNDEIMELVCTGVVVKGDV